MSAKTPNPNHQPGNWFRKIVAGGFLLLLIATPLQSQTLPRTERPEWLRRDGLIMAGNWTALTFRTRQGAREGRVPTAEERAGWEYEHSPEVTTQLKALGVNFIMMHCYHGAGLQIERDTMQDAARFAKQYHEAGLHVGVYVYSGAFLWEPMYREVPESQNWAILDRNYRPIEYYASGYRYYWNRNSPNAKAFYRKIIDFAVNEIKADMLHFDNHHRGSVGRDAYSIEQFRKYLRETFTLEQREQMGAADLSQVLPPMGTQPAEPTALTPLMDESPKTLLDYAWLEFASQSLAGAYMDASRYARSLRRDVLIELNSGGPSGGLRPPLDFGRLLQGGEALWSEGPPSGYSSGRYSTRILAYKIARCLDNLVFFYAATPLSMAESMAFNSDCLGMVCEFTGGKVCSPRPPEAPVSDEVRPYIEFYRTRRELFRDADVVADLAVLRSFPSQVFAGAGPAQLTARVEQHCLNKRIPFQIVHAHQLADLRRYRALVLAGCVALSDADLQQILRYVEQGGRLCVIGPVATHNEWMIPRPDAPLAGVPRERIVSVTADGSVADALRQAVGGRFSAGVIGPERLYAEFTVTPAGRLVHLVNFRHDGPAKDVQVHLRISDGKQINRIKLASPGRKEDLSVKFSVQDGNAMFTVPEVGTYEVVVVE